MISIDLVSDKPLYSGKMELFPRQACFNTPHLGGYDAERSIGLMLIIYPIPSLFDACNLSTEINTQCT